MTAMQRAIHLASVAAMQEQARNSH